MTESTMREYARLGAQVRLITIRAEIAELQRAFPGVGQTPRSTEPKRRAPAGNRSGAHDTPRPLHWTQTPEGKRKMAKVQKRAWARRRAGEAGYVAPRAK